ncbi:retrotransposable element Tf2, partial [Tanacetum coccineum]
MTRENLNDWVKWISLAEYWYKTKFHTVIGTTPYEIVYGQTPPLNIPYMAKDSVVEAVDRTLMAREHTLKLLQFNLKRAQDIMKYQADKGRSNKEFQVSDWVYLKLQTYRQLTLPHYAKVHPVFHDSQLKPCYVKAATIGKFPQCNEEGLLAASPLKLLERKLV